LAIPLDPVLLWELLGILFLLFLSALFSGSETAITSVSRLRIQGLAKEEDDKRAKVLLPLVENPSRMLSALLVGNNLVNVAMSVLAAAIFFQLFPSGGMALATITLTIVILIFGEITPKTYAANNAERMSLRIAPLVSRWTDIAYPVVRLLLPLTNWLTKMLGGNVENTEDLVTEAEIRQMIDVGEKEGVLEENEREMIESIFEFGEAKAKEVMVPRPDVIFVDVNASLEVVLDTVVTSGFSRIPVYEGSEDNIVGLVYAKDLLELMNKKNGSKKKVRIRKLMRPAPIFPETKKIDELLREMQRKKQHMAVMVDEYGDVAGIVTIEDIIEEIVGEIRDEFDQEEEPVEIIDESHALVDGALNLDEVNERFDLELVEEDADTLAGLVVALFGKIPEVGETITWSDERTEVEFTVEQMDRNRIERVRLEVTKREPEDEEGGEVVEESALV